MTAQNDTYTLLFFAYDIRIVAIRRVASLVYHNPQDTYELRDGLKHDSFAS